MERWKPAGIGITLGVFGAAIAIGVMATVLVVRDARAAAGHDRLELAGTLEHSRTVQLVDLSERSAALAVHRWSELGLEVEVAVESTRSASGDAAALIVRRVDDSGVVGLLEAAGFELTSNSWVHRAGTQARVAKAVVAVTVARGGHPSTFVIAGREGAGLEDEAIERLTRDLPRTRPWLTLWSGGERRLDVPLSMAGRPNLSRARTYPISSEGAGSGTVLRSDDEAVVRAESLRSDFETLRLESPAITRVVSLAHIGERGLDGPVQRAGWYVAASHEIRFLRGVTGALDDALADYTRSVLLDAYGPPRETWLLDGCANALVGRVGGFTLATLYAGATGVTFEEVIGESPRTSMAVAAPRAKLAREFIELCGGDRQRAFATSLDGALREQLSAAWLEYTETAAASSGEFPRGHAAGRSLREGTAIRISGAPADARSRLGTEAFRADLARLRDVGFDSIVLEVQVPVAPPGADERQSLPLIHAGWGRSVTLEGDGAVLTAVTQARALGFGVTLSPRVVATPSGQLASRQVHGGPEQYALYGHRLALSVEGVAWLAERARADALVVFTPADMPLARTLVAENASDERRAGYDSYLEIRRATRRGVVAASRSFGGALLGETGSLVGWQHTVADARLGAESVFGADGVGVLTSLEVSGRASPRSLRAAFDRFQAAGEGLEPVGMGVRLGERGSLGALGACLAEGGWPRTAIVDRWDVGPAPGRGTDLRSVTDPELRSLTER